MFCREREILEHTYIGYALQLFSNSSYEVLLTIALSLSNVCFLDSTPPQSHRSSSTIFSIKKYLLHSLIFSHLKNCTEQHSPSPGRIVRSCSALFLCKVYSFHPYHSLLYFSSTPTLLPEEKLVTVTKSRLLRDLQEKQDRGIFFNMFMLLLAAQAAM